MKQSEASNSENEKGQDWSYAYPEEVKIFIEIESSVPHMTDDENEPFMISTQP